MAKYFYINDFPLAIARGGKEEQLRFVAMVARQGFSNVHDLNAERIPPETGDVIHAFGDAPMFGYLIRLLRGQGISPYFVISPNFLRRSSHTYRWMSLIPQTIPTWYSERAQMYRLASAIIVNSQFERRYLMAIFGKWVSSRIHVIPNTFEHLQGSNISCKFSRDDPYYVMVSHLNERKNPVVLIKAATRIFAESGARLKIVGGLRFSSDSGRQEFLDALVESQGVEWLGEKNRETASLLVANALFHVLPSFIESPGIANLEALAIGKGIVVGDCPIVHEYFGEAAVYCGFTVDSVTKTLRRCVANGVQLDPSAVERVMNYVSPTRVSQMYRQVFSSLTESEHPADLFED